MTTSPEHSLVAELIQRARVAAKLYHDFDQRAVDDTVTALAWIVMDEATNRRLSERAVHDTGLGNVTDKMRKNQRKTLGLLQDMQGEKTVGVVAEHPHLGLVEIARPVGVVGAVTPSTNPVATPLNKTMNALKGRNAVILAPSPKGAGVCAELVGLMRAAISQMGAPADLIQMLPEPISKHTTQALMAQCDRLLVTGSQNNVKRAYHSGTAALGVGAGNVVTLLDESADIPSAVEKIIASKTFDNATSCSSENHAIALSANYSAVCDAFRAQHCIILNAEEKNQLQAHLWRDGHLNQQLIAQDAKAIAKACHINVPDNTRVLLVEETDVGAQAPFSGEKLSPILTLYQARDFEDACGLIKQLLNHQGAGHSVGIHTEQTEHAETLGLSLDTCRVIVNQAHCFATGGNFNNGLPFSLSMGCGSWGGNSFDDNLNFRHLINRVKISYPTQGIEPSIEDIFGEWQQRRGVS